MTIGASIFLIAVGAILKYAVNATVSGIEIQTIGLILMIAGVVGLVIGLFLLTQADRRRDLVYDDRDRVRDRDPVVR
jgi:beta-lactamase regulating signal transducer with metallopeptidase domain